MSVECHSVFLCQPKFGVEDASSRTPVLRREVQGKQAADWGETLDGAKWWDISILCVFYVLRRLTYSLLYLQEKGPLSVLLKAVVGPLQHQISEKCTLEHTQEKDLTTAQNQDVGGHLPAQPIIKTMWGYTQVMIADVLALPFKVSN